MRICYYLALSPPVAGKGLNLLVLGRTDFYKDFKRSLVLAVVLTEKEVLWFSMCITNLLRELVIVFNDFKH